MAREYRAQKSPRGVQGQSPSRDLGVKFLPPDLETFVYVDSTGTQEQYETNK